MNTRFIKKVLYLLSAALLLTSASCFAQAQPDPTKHINGPVAERAKKEATIQPNHFAISLYKPTYVLPYYFTGSPDNAVYEGSTPDNESLNRSEFKYQLSFKVPVWMQVLNHPTSNLYLAYSQLSYWQLYTGRPFFRETDYEPELFLANEVNWKLSHYWHINYMNVGVDHQSNGYGNDMERSWNRLYLEAISSSDNWMISLKPWYIMSTNSNNRNINKYLGYGRILVAYKFDDHVLSLQAHNLIEGYARRATAEVTWSFPLTPYLKGFVQVFSGYGQSLIEYNHRTNSFGVGIALNDWV